MDTRGPPVALDNGLDLSKLCTTGSVLQINEDYGDTECTPEQDNSVQKIDYIGEPVDSFEVLEKELQPVDKHELVKKKVLEEGGGVELNKGCTVSLAYAGYWEKELEPFDYTKSHKPLVINLNDNGLLPGLQIAIESMLVGETSVFLISYKVMYGEMGVPPRIKPKADCVFYIQLIKSIITPKDGKLDLSQPNIFQRVHYEVKLLYSSGCTLYKTKNFPAAIHVFRKAIDMLHRCRLSDEIEEKTQEKLLIKMYINLAICYNETKQPLKVCIACNELNRLNSLWNNSKVLYHNAKALRMIGQFDAAERKLKRALHLLPDDEKLKSEFELLVSTKDNFNQTKLVQTKFDNSNGVNDNFKKEVDSLIEKFKTNVNLCKLTLPEGLNAAEIDYIKEVCVREKLFCNKIQKDYLLDKDENSSIESKIDLFI